MENLVSSLTIRGRVKPKPWRAWRGPSQPGNLAPVLFSRPPVEPTLASQWTAGRLTSRHPCSATSLSFRALFLFSSWLTSTHSHTGP
ncbi:hypothetical protein JTE90_011147 [Oedothorax gibbosus]|uniref:Uncharacterized protein n=1 Tax=Oedothorax gibbosus TaxID=931172 RepID=A0AAV6U037_9ARAC|nr:hypothetical protein JTE90_011147 [Oedothorax gibbosus]